MAFLYSWAHLLLSSTLVVMQDTAFRQLIGYVSANPTPAMIGAFALMSAPLVVRRKFPIPVTAITFALYIALVQAVGGYGVLVISPAVGLFSIAEKGNFKISLAALLVLAGIEIGMNVPFINAHLMWILHIQNIAILTVSMVLGVAISTYRRYVYEAAAHAQAVADAQKEETERRLSQERIAIAREVHDITAHSLTAVNIQAAAAERLVERDPKTAKAAIHQIRETSKESLNQIRHLVKGLRSNDEAAEMIPTQGTEALSSLINFAHQAHLELTIDTDTYDAARVAPYVDVVVFDIARESITNVIRHAHATKAHISVSLAHTFVHIQVTDNGQGSAGVQGNGLMGMAERVRILHGTFAAHTNPDGGFLVEARIPADGDEHENAR